MMLAMATPEQHFDGKMGDFQKTIREPIIPQSAEMLLQVIVQAMITPPSDIKHLMPILPTTTRQLAHKRLQQIQPARKMLLLVPVVLQQIPRVVTILHWVIMPC